jgi:integrase
LRGRSDAARLGPHHIKNGIITIQPRKTRNSTGATVTVPMLPDLKAALDAMPKPPANVAPTTFLYGANGQMLPSSTFGQWFGRSVDAAGLPKVEVDEKLKNLRAHGLRKSCAVRLADAGCDVLTIGAVIGDEKLENIAIYIRKRSRAKASLAGMGKLMDMLALKRAAA